MESMSKKLLHTCFFACKRLNCFSFGRNFLYNPSEKAKPIGRTGAEQYEYWNADTKKYEKKRD